VRVTAQFCESIGEITAERLSTEVLSAVRSLILDGIAVAIAGSRERAPTILAQHLRDLSYSGQSTVLNFGFKSNAVGAAFVNGASMHVLDYEPMWNPPTHALSTTLPTVLALGEALALAGPELTVALTKGIEAHCRLRLASRQYEPRGLRFHPPGIAGPIGSAVAAAHLLRLDAEQLRNAIGIASSRAGALLANIGIMTKCTHCGKAASDGLEAAMLAARGLDANPDIIEASNGLAAAFFSQDWDPTALITDKSALQIVHPGYAIKLFPSQYATHFVIAAALDARNGLATDQAIAAVEIVGPVMPYVDRPQPLSGLDTKFSFQYAAASALLDGSVGIDTFTDERRSQADINAMLRKVKLAQSPEIPATLDKMWVEVKVTQSDGRIVVGKCTRPRGAWGSPVSPDEHLRKVRDCMNRVLRNSQTERVLSMVQKFDQLDAAEIRALMHMLAGSS
jgi:2-methylcitrate dehydratase PrpD